MRISTQELPVIQCVGQLAGALADEPRRDAGDNGIRRNIAGDDSARCHNSAFADGNAGQNHRLCTNERSVVNDNRRAAIFKSGTVGIVLQGQEYRPLRDAHIVSNGESAASIQQDFAVDDSVRANGDARRPVKTTQPMNAGMRANGDFEKMPIAPQA